MPIPVPIDFRAALNVLLQQQARPSDKYGHQPRLYHLTRLVGEGLVYDDEIVYAATFLHDIGVFVGNRPEDPDLLAGWDHVRYALQAAPVLLEKAGFPPHKVEAVLSAIAQHQPHDTPQSLEATILRDADMLEQLGAIGILRAVAKVGRDTRFPTFTPAVAALRRAIDTLPPRMLLPTTRVLAAPRIALLRDFLAGVEQEAQDCLF